MTLENISSINNPARSTIVNPNGESSSTSVESVAKTKSDFLKLLTTQLQNQDPTKPTDNAQFTQQITAINTLEQQLDSNVKLGQLVTSQNASALSTQLASSVNYIGKSVEVENNVFRLDEAGDPKLGYDVPAGITNSIITISNENGQVIGSYQGETTEGKQNLVWDGKDADGNRLPPANYRISVSLTDTNNQQTSAKTYVFGEVTSIELNEGQASVVIDDSYVLPIDAVRAIEQQQQQQNVAA